MKGNSASTVTTKPSAFTLVEVLLGFALAIIMLGTVLNSVSRQTVSISRSRIRYQSVLRASHALELKMEQDAARDRSAPVIEDRSEGPKVLINVRPVTADPRVEQIEATAPYGPGLQTTLSVYRLRVRRQESSKSDAASTTK